MVRKPHGRFVSTSSVIHAAMRSGEKKNEKQEDTNQTHHGERLWLRLLFRGYSARLGYRAPPVIPKQPRDLRGYLFYTTKLGLQSQ